MERSRKSRYSKALFWGVLSGLALLGMSIPGRLIVSPTPSDGRHVFVRAASSRPVRVGDYVVFPMRTRYVERCTDGCLLLKRVVCGPGSVLEVRGRDFYCDGRYLGRAKERSRKGEPVEPFRYSGIIPGGKFFVMGSHEDSFDSRYFGFVDASSVVARAVPLF